jgi:hypothetical protein
MNFLKKIKQGTLGVSVLVGSTFSAYAADPPAPTPATTSNCGNLGSACDFTALAGNVKGAMTSAATMFYSGAAIIGIALVVIGLLKMKAHSMDSQGTSGHLRSAIWLLIIGALMIAVPVIMMLGANTLVGTNVNLPSESNIFSSTGTAK